MGYPYPGFPYLDKPYSDHPHTVAPFGEIEHRVDDIFHIHDLTLAVMEAVSNDDVWHILGFLYTKCNYNYVSFSKV